MVFTSLLFLLRFLPIILIYFLVPRKGKNLILFLGSLFFYAWGEPVCVLLMLLTTVLAYTFGIFTDKFKKEGNEKKAKLMVLCSVVVSLLILGFFKYADFIVENLNLLLHTGIPKPEIGLPIGISFYTFQTMSYTIDVYRKEAKVQKNFISFGTYVALFPQLIAGPIVQYKTVAEQLDNRKESVNQFADGVVRFITGMGKKVLLANNIGILWTQIKAMQGSDMAVLTAWIGAMAFALQIYFDFSGYSDMAIGLGKMFGFEFLENFNYPYMSRSITEFWRRWHISLGTWFRDYVYIPLGGNRVGKAKQIRNIAIVWILTGLWHGASWNFVVWGAYFGILLLIEKLFLKKWLDKCPKILQRIYTLFIVLISWVIFDTDNMSAAVQYIKNMFVSGQGFINGTTLYIISSYLVVFIIAIIACTEYPRRLVKWIEAKVAEKKGTALAAWITVENICLVGMLLLCIAYLVNSSYNPFLYFRF